MHKTEIIIAVDPWKENRLHFAFIREMTAFPKAIIEIHEISQLPLVLQRSKFVKMQKYLLKGYRVSSKVH